jgi:hypothetical protein
MRKISAQRGQVELISGYFPTPGKFRRVGKAMPSGDTPNVPGMSEWATGRSEYGRLLKSNTQQREPLKPCKPIPEM